MKLEQYRNLALLLLEDHSFFQSSSTKKGLKETRYVIQAQIENDSKSATGNKGEYLENDKTAALSSQ